MREMQEVLKDAVICVKLNSGTISACADKGMPLETVKEKTQEQYPGYSLTLIKGHPSSCVTYPGRCHYTFTVKED